MCAGSTGPQKRRGSPSQRSLWQAGREAGSCLAPVSAKSGFPVSPIFLLAEEGEGVSAETPLLGSWSERGAWEHGWPALKVPATKQSQSHNKLELPVPTMLAFQSER